MIGDAESILKRFSKGFVSGSRMLVVVAALWGAVPAIAIAQMTFVKVADEWATIQPGGPRLPQFGNRNWNIEGGDAGAFASSGTLRFYMADLVSQLDSNFPGGWQIDKVTLVVEHDDAGFTLDGGVSIFHFTNDDLAITNGMDSVFEGSDPDDAPGNFGETGLMLDPSPLVFDDTGTSDGQPVRVLLNDFTTMADMGTVTRANDYMFTAQDDDNLDVFGTSGSLVDPTGATNAGPDYGLSFPSANDPDETLANFTTELATDSGDWIPAGRDAIVADIEDGSDALSFIFATTDAASTVAATYKGNPFATLFPPRLYIEASSTAVGLTGDYDDTGQVAQGDLDLVLLNWGKTVPPDPVPDGWINEQPSGLIGQGALDGVLLNWGNTLSSGGGANSSPVPEPATFLILAIAVPGLLVSLLRQSQRESVSK
jgi:hypothetical protein